MRATPPPLPDDPLVPDLVEFCEHHRLAESSARLDQQPEFPWEIFRRMGHAGYLGLTVPSERGGRGLPATRAAVLLFHLAYRSGTTFAKLSLQPEFASVLGEQGGPELVAEYFAPMLRGETLVANQVTEPAAGSDAGGLQLTAALERGEYRLDGVKTEAAFAVDARAAIVYGRTSDEPGTRGISAFLVEQDREGVRRSLSPPDLGERWMRRGQIVYEGVRVPIDHRLGPEGSGFKLVRTELTRERGLLAAIYLGVARAAWDRSLQHAAQRRAFGEPLARQSAVRDRLVDAWAELESSWLLVLWALERFDRGERADAYTALAKATATRVALEVIDTALQFHGGRGYSSELPFERWWRDVRSGGIAHGPTEIMRRIASKGLWGEDGPP
ncbi:MAG: acyl-CoA dehydrogenase family protein [Thermoplasmata archaeon]